MARHRLLRPAWLLTHLLVLGGFVAMVNLGIWQLSRLDERRANNADLERAMSEPRAPLHEVLAGGGEWANLPVEVRGAFDPARQVYVVNRSRDGRPGVHVVTLIEGEHGAAAVNRGFLVRQAYLDGEAGYWDPPPGEVVVTGWVRQPRQSRRGAGDEVDAVDLADLSERWGVPLQAAYVEATAGAAAGDWPQPLRPPDLTDGPHLGYAVQWFVFAAIALVGYPVVLGRIARDERLGLGDG